ncbi:MAG TPA: glucose-6-phosphate isomerase [Candidatus Dormibacteraeota bacterium]|nr:glucose-6-phosphate isomerase [Candidatus Dormibacteraeota bacterium]
MSGGQAGDLSGLGNLRGAVEEALERMNRERWAERINAKDGSLWSVDPEKAREIEGWLGWLNVAGDISQELEQFTDLQRDLDVEGYTIAVLAGMGGSSLCPDVLRRTFGTREGALDLTVLDSTDPSTVEAVESGVDLLRTMFIISSKSGGTTETLSHFKYFGSRIAALDADHRGRHFLAVTDEGSGLQKTAVGEEFGWVFLNPADIGGRYSALSYFGMVPAAVMGLDVTRLLAGGQAMGQACRIDNAADNPGLVLGAALGVAATSGRDKCTLICSPQVASLGMWLEQLLAESTGKEGKGIIPVEGEPLGSADGYGQDRFFVHIRVVGDGAEQDDAVKALMAAGHPVLTVQLDTPDDIGAEFMRWEFATAAAGALLGINPFDQPNVQESKDNTIAALRRYADSGDFGVDISAAPLEAAGELLSSVKRGDYFAILAYTQPTADVDEALQRIRAAVRDRFGVATTIGYGPRYLHSTGQLHKGGPGTGVYLMLTDQRGPELPIPGADYGFKTLIQAQWAGDLKSLRDHGRRVTMVPMADERTATLAEILELVEGIPISG